jgi:hypothetical protein
VRTRLATAAPDLTDLTGLVDLALVAQRGEIPMPVDPALLAAADQFLKRVMDR